MLSDNGLIQVLRVEAYMEGTIRLVRVCEGRYQFGRLGDWGNDSECDHVIKGLLYLGSVLHMHFPMGVLGRGNGRSAQMV